MTKLQGAMIGFGNIAEFGHWPSYAESRDCEIVAVVEPSASRQEAAKALRSGLRVYSTPEELFATEKLDFVDICTPPASHASLAQAALKNGCHVLCEKPLALSATDFVALAQLSTQVRRTVFTVHNWKYAPIFQKAFSLLKEGRIGPVWHVEIFTLRDSHCQGAEANDWRKDPAMAGGGIVVDHGWHAFYLLLSLVGADPERLLAKMLLSQSDPNGLEEAVQALVQFPEADGYIHLSWRAKMRRNSLMVQGLNGTLLLDDDRILLTTHSGGREEIKFDAALSAGSHHADWFKNLLPDFLTEVKNPAKRGANLREAGWCVALTSAAYESNLRGSKEVAVSFPGTPKQEPALA